MLRLADAGEGCRSVEFGADGWVNSLDVEGLQVCGFALRLLAGDLFDPAVEPLKWKDFEVDHFRVQSNAILTAGFDFYHERLLAGLSSAPGNGEGVCSGQEMKGHEAAGADVRQRLLFVEEPTGKGLRALWKKARGYTLRRIAWCVEGDNTCLGDAGHDEERRGQHEAKERSHGLM
jgi:hypothetical protein